MAMKRVSVDGRVLNKRTADMLAMWEFNSLTKFYVVQGSYNAGVSQSGNTHDGGGALDVSTYGWGTSANKTWLIKQGRLAGFALWLRLQIPGLWNEHAHGIALGDKEASPNAKDQMADYRAGRNGLANNGPDDGPRLSVIRVWPNRPLKKVSLFTVFMQFRSKTPKQKTAVKRVQWVLNEKLGLNLVCDGVAGPKTKDAYLKWEKKNSAGAPDGVPGRHSLSELGVGRFNVTTVGYEKWRKQKAAAKAEAAAEEKKSPVFPK